MTFGNNIHELARTMCNDVKMATTVSRIFNNSEGMEHEAYDFVINGDLRVIMMRSSHRGWSNTTQSFVVLIQDPSDVKCLSIP